jgi:FkbM family methyltransferase
MMSPLFQKIRGRARRAAVDYLRKRSFVHADEFTRPYIIEKTVVGEEFLFHITDQHARLWYDLYSRPDWLEMLFIKENLVRPGDVVIECGSHHGCTAIMLSRWVVPIGKVYAYEPGARNYDVLRRNLRLNGVENVIAVRAAVGNETKTIEFIEIPDASMGSHVATGAVSHDKAQEVPQVCLDVDALEKPDLIKLDTQGYVYQPLVGLQNILKTFRPNLALEIDRKSDLEAYNSSIEQIVDLISFDDYTYFVQFHEREKPRPITLPNVLAEWKRLNNCNEEIHLYAKKTG